MSAADAKGFGMWACPHHQCGQCGRKAAAAGGLLFRCAMCPRSFCEDHLPAEAIIMGECERFLALGARHPKQGCYILCKTPCVAKAACGKLRKIDVLRRTFAKNRCPEVKFRENSLS